MADNISDTTTPDPVEIIRQNSQAPAQASDDSGSMQSHPIPDQIAADRYAESKAATRKRRFPVGLSKISPGGAL